MRARRPARRAYIAQNVADLNVLTLADYYVLSMSVQSRKIAAMINDHVISVTAAAAAAPALAIVVTAVVDNGDDRTRLRRVNVRTAYAAAADIDTLMVAVAPRIVAEISGNALIPRIERPPEPVSILDMLGIVRLSLTDKR